MSKISRKAFSITVLIVLFFLSQKALAIISVSVDCTGCDKRVGNYYYISKDKPIVLSAEVQNAVGNPIYEWQDNGKTVQKGKFYQLMFRENVRLTLKVSDSLGYVNADIFLVESSSKGINCIPYFAIESTNSIKGKSELSPGDFLNLEVSFQKAHECNGYSIKWESENPYVKIYSPTSLKTKIEIGKDAKIGTPAEISVTVNNKQQFNKTSVKYSIVSNTKPEIKKIDPIQPLSYSYFNINIEYTSGTGWNENRDFITYYELVLKNETGIFVEKKSGTLKKGEKPPTIRLKAGKKDLYILEARIVDSHGVSSNVSRHIFEVEKGNTGEDVPELIIDDVFYCIQYQKCSINAKRTYDNDDDISSYSFNEGKSILIGEQGYPCSGYICNTIFTYPGNHSIVFTAGYPQGKKASKTVTVVVSSDKAMPLDRKMPERTIQPKGKTTPTQTDYYDPEMKKHLERYMNPKPIPESIAVAFISITAAIFKRFKI